MNFVVNESLAGIKLAPRLAIDNKDITTLNRATRTCSIRSLVHIIIRKSRRIEAANPSQLANAWLSRDVRSHMQGTVRIANHIVMCQS